MIPGICPTSRFLILPALFLGCTAPLPPEPSPVTPPPEAVLTFSTDSLQASVRIPAGAVLNDTLLNPLIFPPTNQLINPWLEEIEDDSLRQLVKKLAVESLPKNVFRYSLTGIHQTAGHQTMVYELDTTLISHFIHPLIDSYGSPGDVQIYPLFSEARNPPDIDALQSLSLDLPCQNTPIPNNAKLLPNAPREYRHGTHRGIDFYADWGTPVRAVASGTVIRADHNYIEVEPEFREKLLEKAHKTGHTPSDIFNHILLGQAVFIDHGFDLVPGYRAISIYAHLSGIQKKLFAGTFVNQGEVIGQSGNSGIKDATLGKRTGAHLHWELILQNKGGEYYLGQGFNYDDLITTLHNIFAVK